jgi:serine/threonine-protein kinase TTK/MPS1
VLTFLLHLLCLLLSSLLSSLSLSFHSPAMSLSPSTSPPRTPNDNRATARPKSTTPTSDDSSIIDDLSFDYIFDQEGNFVRLSKGSSKSNHSSPPTPQEAPLDDPPRQKPPSPDLLASPIGRISLTRSESAFPILSGNGAGSSSTVANDKPARSFQRVASGPVLSTPSYLAPTASSLSKPRIVARRTTTEDARERADSMGALKARQTIDLNVNAYTLQEEKENISETDDHPYIQTASIAPKQRSSPPLVTRSLSSTSSRVASARAAYLANGASSASGRPLADMPAPQRASYGRQILPTANRAGRIMKSTSASKYSSAASAANFDRISEFEHSENEGAGGRYSPMTAPTAGDETEPEDEPPAVIDPANVPVPSTSASVGSHLGPTRVRTHTASSVNVNAPNPTSTLSTSGNTRPRRSASLSDALSKLMSLLAA